MSRYRRDMYRFALYGRSGSGKTCVLGMLSLGAVGHPGGLTSVRMPVEVPNPAEPDDRFRGLGLQESGEEALSNWTVAQREAAGLHAGQAWIDQAERALGEGRLPDANDPLGGPPWMVDFKIGSPDRGEIPIRTIDYAGEIVKSDDADDPDSMSNALKRCLQDFDGFVVLAEAPRRGQPNDSADEELRLLLRAFTALRQAQQDLGEAAVTAPVAVMFTKWDRRLASGGAPTPQALRESAEAFLAEHPPHQALVDAVRNALADQAVAHELPDCLPGVPLGNCAVFPASAFGKAEQRDAKDYPAQGGAPFGLLDPFVWLADRRDALDAEQLRAELEAVRPVRGVPSWRFWRYRDLSQGAANRLKRMPADSAAALATRSIRRQARTWFAISGVCWLILLALAADLMYGGVWSRQFQHQVAICRNPQTDEQQLLQARKWFDDYRLGWNGVLIAPTPQEAVEQVRRVDDEIERRYWDPVESAEELKDKAKTAQRYRQRLPNGNRVAEAERIVAAWEKEKANIENGRWLAKWESEAEQAMNEDLEQKIEAAIAGLGAGFPHPLDASPEQFRQLDELNSPLRRRLAEIQADMRWQRFVGDYRRDLSESDFEAAAELLSEWEPKHDQWRKLVEGFGGEIAAQFTPRLAELLKDNAFPHAEQTVHQAVDGLKRLEAALRPTQPELADGLLAGQQNLHRHRADIQRRHDRHLYQRLLDNRTRQNCRHYLDHAPLQAMQPEVEAYQRYLDHVDKPLNLSLSARILWHKDYAASLNAKGHTLEVSIDDTDALRQPELGSAPGKLSGDVGPLELKGRRRSDSVKVQAALRRPGITGFLGDYESFSGTRTIRLSEFQRGEQSIQLSGNKGATYKHELRLQIAGGLPAEPDMPSWRKP